MENHAEPANVARPVRRNPQPPQSDVEDDREMFADLLKFILQCLPTALSIIMADCQYDRVTLLRKILDRNTGFLSTIINVYLNVENEQDDVVELLKLKA